MPEDPPYVREPAYMSFSLAYFITRNICRFRVYCRRCKRYNHIYLTTIMEKHRSSEPLSTVKIKCSKCRGKDCSIAPDLDYKPDGKVIAFPKRL